MGISWEICVFFFSVQILMWKSHGFFAEDLDVCWVFHIKNCMFSLGYITNNQRYLWESMGIYGFPGVNVYQPTTLLCVIKNAREITGKSPVDFPAMELITRG